LNLAETTLVRSRPPVTYGANLLLLESIENYFPGLCAAYKKGTYPNFWQCLMSDIA